MKFSEKEHPGQPNPLEGETLDNLTNQDSSFHSPPLEGLGEVKKEKDEESKIPGYITANPQSYHLIKNIRDSLKENPTFEEELLWKFLKNKRIGYKIRRQHIIDNFITDFVCLSKKLVIEVDGIIHLKQREHDTLRTMRLNELGFDVIRFTNEEVTNNTERVTLIIKEILDKKTSQ